MCGSSRGTKRSIGQSHTTWQDLEDEDALDDIDWIWCPTDACPSKIQWWDSGCPNCGAYFSQDFWDERWEASLGSSATQHALSKPDPEATAAVFGWDNVALCCGEHWEVCDCGLDAIGPEECFQEDPNEVYLPNSECFVCAKQGTPACPALRELVKVKLDLYTPTQVRLDRYLALQPICPCSQFEHENPIDLEG